jgi:type VI secretion system secreted protein Hcp
MATLMAKWPGEIKGSATAEGAKVQYKDGWIDCSSLAFNVERSIKQGAAAATNREAAHPVISQVTLGKTSDLASTLLFQESVVGKPKLVEIHACSSASDGKMRPWMIIKLTNCIIAQFKQSGEADGMPKEELSLAWTKIEFEFKIYDESNTKELKNIPFGYDLALNKMT